MCDDLEKSAKFYCRAFDLKEISRRGDLQRGGAIYLSDGTLNIALTKITDPNFPDGVETGLNHIGFFVEDVKAAVAHAESCGATRTISEEEQLAHAAKFGVKEVFEVKMITPDGVRFDLTEIGWPGAQK
jgi:catechol 2,3-dioxygenase-like lactoylglutathione lyase family enzyme